MITKERLEELIEQKKQVWKIYKDTCQGAYQVPAGLFGIGFSSQVDETTPFNELFETKEEAEWHKEFGCIERTIKLDLPKWEDIEKDKNFHYIRHFVITKNFSFFIEIYKFTNTISVSWSGGCKKTDPRFDRNWELTKENYTLACRKAKELFLGEKK